MPAKEGVSTHVMKRAWPERVVKSATMIGAIALSLRWSTPKAELTPKAFKAAVTRPEPANISMTTGPSKHLFVCFLKVLSELSGGRADGETFGLGTELTPSGSLELNLCKGWDKCFEMVSLLLLWPAS